MRAIGGRAWAAFAFVVFLAVSAGVPAQNGKPDSLEIVTSTGRHAFQVEIADNDATRERGLIDRRSWRPTTACCSSSTARPRCPSG